MIILLLPEEINVGLAHARLDIRLMFRFTLKQALRFIAVYRLLIVACPLFPSLRKIRGVTWTLTPTPAVLDPMRSFIMNPRARLWKSNRS